MKIIHFILSTWGDSHELSRTINIEKKFRSVERHAYLRDYYPSGYDYLQKGIIGHLNNGIYSNRFVTYVKAIFYFYKLKKSKNDFFYIFGLDNYICFYISCFFNFAKINVIYEIDDVRDIVSQDNLLSKIFFNIECFLIKKSKLLITTSEAFLEEFYFKKGKFILPYTLIENKVQLDIPSTGNELTSVNSKNKTSKINLGFFGLIRCSRSVEILLELVRNFSNIEVIIRGYFMPNCKHLEAEIEKTNGINYFGPYVSPKDLISIYSEIDISWICYPYGFEGENNWKWARTNRFYEAGYFKKPMIAAAGTKDAIRVKEYGVGFTLNLADTAQCVRELSQITHTNIYNITQNYNFIDANKFQITDDYDILVNRINEI